MPRRTTKARAKKAPNRSPKGGSGERPLVVYIHGIGAQAAPTRLKLEWDLALFGRDLGDQSRMAHWADILHGTSPAAAVGKRRVREQSTGVAGLLEQAGVSPSNPKALALASTLLHAAGVNETEGTRKKLLPLPGFLRPPITKAFLNAFVGDTAAYFFRSDVRRKIRQRLLDALPDGNTPIVLVAHSQGTVVALEVLASLGNTRTVAQFVTLGSPLAIQEIQDLLDCECKVPANVQRWHNFADPFDVVALDKGIGDEFEPLGTVTDVLISNARTRLLPGFNPHSAVGYLVHPSVRSVVSSALRVDTMSRFVMARDVAERLAADIRHPVLIEILEPGYPALGETEEQTRQREQRGEQGKPTLSARIDDAAARLATLVTDPESARIDRLRRFVAAHLTPSELQDVAEKHVDLRVYSIWRSSTKQKLLQRSVRVLQGDAALASYGAAGDGITWAVLDTGIQANHPHFQQHGNIVSVWDCTKSGPPRRVDAARDPDGHGTHVAGIIAGTSGNGSTPLRQGMAPRTRLVIYKVLNDAGEGEDAWIIKALDHIATTNENNSAGLAIHGLNLSLGGPYDVTTYGCGFSPVCAELRRAWRAGVVVCVSAGNEGQVQVESPDGQLDLNSPMSIGDPANLEDCIAVGSVNADRPHLYGISWFSSRGPTSDGRVKPDVVAPGERICSCNARFRKRGNKYEELYYEESGTSMAAPHVSGLIAAFLSIRREFRGRPDEVKDILLKTCTDLGRDRYHQGRGMPNLMRMLLAV